ncbi:hypothetical protein CKU_2491 [Staphylococcus aureus]|nr:hypothetical protein CKU_2491 [Staphylococcus aureus]
MRLTSSGLVPVVVNAIFFEICFNSEIVFYMLPLNSLVVVNKLASTKIFI